ncbi:hypothetical protein B0H67DRAFT_599823 [Lasiosphaeris hirsuta]|uniref:TauD/TfdA-like domain-containing protein n=1 Tax=Lasiosphaeris hirsuta TaxID=260670 RepID=A0AA40E2K0_9PEZI|nr:hypothetical protein B0H67DRAFT_599823 [Lasiosphaeris hirsuta]
MAKTWMSEDSIDMNTSAPTTPNVIYINMEGVAEIEQALQAFKKLGLDGDAVNRDNFRLPTLQARLELACDEVHHGLGFVIFRGLNPNNYTPEDNVIAFLGMASYIGDTRGVQDKQGSMLTHVTDSKTWTVPPELRHGIHTTTGLAWHSDMGVDILALHVRAQAEHGGDTYVASSQAIYQELMASYPKISKVLSQSDWPVQISGNPPRHILAPLLKAHEGNIMISVDPGRLGLHPVTARKGLGSSIPSLTSAQRDALDVLSALASKHRLHLDTKPGDMVFINNWALLHARDPYVDSDNGPRRHLVRLWLRNSELAWDVPESMKVPWEAAFGPNGDGDPAGVYLEKKYPVLPTPEYNPPKFTSGSAAFILEDSDDVNAEAMTHA